MMKEFTLNNNILSVYKQNDNTPRVAFSLNVAINSPEKHAGCYSLMNRLLLQGTKKYTNTKLAEILDENAIDLNTDMKQDYLKFRFVCLNEDFELAVNILDDIIKNSTFDEFEKEKEKMRGEIIADLDSARTKISDAFVKTIYKDHYYGHSCTLVLEALDSITKEDVVSSYNKIIQEGKKVLSIVGSLDFDFVEPILNNSIGKIIDSPMYEKNIEKPVLETTRKVEVIKEDANQAQILQGWIVPNSKSEDYPTLAVINTILGASGLSSRLFLELRDKKGLAYTVRTSCDPKELCSVFSIYIATEPSNIEISLEGFTEEINKIKNIPVSVEELTDAKNNIAGKQQFLSETNSQQANSMAYYGLMGFGFDYQLKLLEKIKNVTSEQIMECANKYFDENFVTAILRP